MEIINQQFTLLDGNRYQLSAEIEFHNPNGVGIEGYIILSINNVNVTQNDGVISVITPENQSCFYIPPNSTCTYSYNVEEWYDTNLVEEFFQEIVSAEYVITNFIF